MDKRRVNVRAIIYKDGKLFMVKHLEKDGSAARYFATPGGGLDAGESLEEGIKREVIEELGVEPVVGRLLFMQQFKSERRDWDEELEFFYHIENPSDFEDIDLTKTTHGHIELAVCGFYSPKDEDLLPSFLRRIDIGSYIDQVKPVENFIEL